MVHDFPARTGDFENDPESLEGWFDEIHDYLNGFNTFTPTLTFATPGDLNVVYSTQVGFYRRLGKQIHCIGNLVTSTWTHSTASGNHRISGFPYAGRTGLTQIGSLAWDGITKANYTQADISMSGNTFVNVRMSGSGQNQFIATTAEMASGTQQTRYFNITYFTD